MEEAATITRRRAGIAGFVSVALALGVSELLAGLLSAGTSLVFAIGEFVIDVTPERIVRFGIRLFGVHDKLALVIGIVIVSLIIGAAVGMVARRRFNVAVAVFVLFALAGVLAGLRVPLTSAFGVVVSAVGGAAVGIVALRYLLRSESGGEAAVDQGRRRFLLGAGAVFAVAAVAAASGRVLIERARAALASRDDVVLPPPDDPATAVAADLALDVPGVSPLVVPNDDFYRIDTAISVPRVNLEDWKLSITGMVDRPFELSFNDLLDLPLIERDVTLQCVSNRIGGNLVGNARWLGVPLRDVLDRARISDGAQQVVGRSVDGFTVGFPVDVLTDDRVSMIAVGMNGEPLPFEHGFPARLIVAGLYGYVSATKWLSEIELTTWDGFDAYWIPRGWAKEAPIKTASRIDVPRQGEQVTVGPQVIAGVAWAPSRGISKVEVQIDDGPWQEAELSGELSINSWRQWALDWEATPGNHTIQARATDDTGETQTSDRTDPAPDGATGWPNRTITVV